MCDEAEKKAVESFSKQSQPWKRIKRLERESKKNEKNKIDPIKKPCFQEYIIYAFISEWNTEYIKIGHSTEILKRLDELNHSKSPSGIKYEKYQFHYLCAFWGNEYYEFLAQIELAKNGRHIEGEIFRCTYEEVEHLFSNLKEIDFENYCENFSDNMDNRLSFRKKMFGK